MFKFFKKLLILVRIWQSNLTWLFYIEEIFSERFWFYFDLFWSNLTSISTFSLILWFIWDYYWFKRTIRTWSEQENSFEHFISQLKSFYQCWLNWLIVLSYFIHSDWFILIYLIDFVDYHWYFEADRLTVFCQSEKVCCIYTVNLTVCTVWLTLAQLSFKIFKNLRF